MARARRGDKVHDDAAQLGEALRELVVSKLAEKAATRQKETAKGRFQAEALEMLSERISGLDLWTRIPPGERPTRIRREELAAAAVRIADRDGLDALSMRRLAAEVGVGTMTLYHYIRNKDELLTLLFDAVMGELVVPDGEGLSTDWREALTTIAVRSRDVLTRHAWILDIADDPPIGPNSVRHFDQSLEAVASIDRPLADRLDIVALVDEFVFGYCLQERNNARTGGDDDRELLAYLTVLLETDAYPTLAKLVDEFGVDGVWAQVQRHNADPGAFRRHLDRVLDGIAAGL